MPSFLLSDFPRIISHSDYDECTVRLIEATLSMKGVLAVYGIGSVSSPGISDLDLVAVFQEDIICDNNVRSALSADDKYLLIHSMYGASANRFLKAQDFTFFQPYKLLAGNDLLPEKLPVPDPSVRLQVALEYLLKFYISLKLQHAYKLIRIRSILLNAKGSFIDLRYLSPGNPDVEEFHEELKSIRSKWFIDANSSENFQSWFHRFSNWFFTFVEELFHQHSFYLPEIRRYRMSKNILLQTGDRLKVTKIGANLPFLYKVMGDRYFKVLNRINQLNFSVPATNCDIPSPVLDYFHFAAEYRQYNRIHLPHFLPLASSLHLK